MKKKMGILCVAIAVAVAIVWVGESTVVAADAAAADKPQPQQLLVSVRVGGATFGMLGQELPIPKEQADGMALPALQKAGWRIVSVNMTGSAGVNQDQQSALVLLEK